MVLQEYFGRVWFKMYFVLLGTWWVGDEREPKENVFYSEIEDMEGHVVLGIICKEIIGLFEAGYSTNTVILTTKS